MELIQMYSAEILEWQAMIELLTLKVVVQLTLNIALAICATSWCPQ